MKTFKLVISSPDGDMFRDNVLKISLRGIEGELAVMAGHIPFITAVKPGKCKIVLADEKEKLATIGGGILTVQGEKTTLLCSDFSWN